MRKDALGPQQRIFAVDCSLSIHDLVVVCRVVTEYRVSLPRYIQKHSRSIFLKEIYHMTEIIVGYHRFVGDSLLFRVCFYEVGLPGLS